MVAEQGADARRLTPLDKVAVLLAAKDAECYIERSSSLLYRPSKSID